MDRAALEAKKREYQEQLAKAQQAILRLQGAIAAIDDLLKERSDAATETN